MKTSKDNLKLRLLSQRPLREFGMEELKEYVESLYERKKAPKAWNFRINHKGTPVLTVRDRKPKFLLPEEFAELMEESKMTESQLKQFLKEKKIELKG